MEIQKANTRYDGRPLLRFIDAYVLDAMGELADDSTKRLDSITPTLQSVYHVADSDWRVIVERVMDFPPELRVKIKTGWEATQDKASRKGYSLDAIEFAQFVADILTGVESPWYERDIYEGPNLRP